MAFRFVHCADVHLDSPLRSLALRDPELAALVGTATRQAFAATIDLCLEERVDALLVAGDLYDGDQTSMKTARFLGDQLKRLDAAGIRTFAIRGNHDHLARITRELLLPDSVHVFGGRADRIDVDAGGITVCLHGLSYAQAHAPESLLPRYRPPAEGAVNIGLLHTSLGGAPGHDPYAPCSPGDLEGSGFRYWALGHVHARSVAEGRCTVAMAGMPQGRDVGEAGPKSVTLVTVADDGAISTAERTTSVAQFERVDVDASGARDWRGLVAAVGARLEAARAAARSEHLVARIAVTGSSPLAWRVRRDADLLRAEAESHAAALGRTWIDKVEVAARPVQAGGGLEGPLAELRRTMERELLGSADVAAAVLDAIAELRRQLPPECRDLLGEGGGAAEAVAARLMAGGLDDVLARVLPDAEAA